MTAGDDPTPATVSSADQLDIPGPEEVELPSDLAGLKRVVSVQSSELFLTIENFIHRCMTDAGFDYIHRQPDIYPDFLSSETPVVDELEYQLTHVPPADPNEAMVAELSAPDRTAWYTAFFGTGVELNDDGGTLSEELLDDPSGVGCENYGALTAIGLDERNAMLRARRSIGEMEARVDSDPRVIAEEERRNACIADEGIDWTEVVGGLRAVRSDPDARAAFLGNIDQYRELERDRSQIVESCSEELSLLREEVAVEVYDEFIDNDDLAVLVGVYGNV